MNPKPFYCDVLVASDEPPIVHVRKASTPSNIVVRELDLIGQVQMRMLIKQIRCII
jgi:hypothetical protein